MKDLYTTWFLLTEKSASLLALKHEDETGTSGNGQEAQQELVAEYNKVTHEAGRPRAIYHGAAGQLQHEARPGSGRLLHGEDSRVL